MNMKYWCVGLALFPLFAIAQNLKQNEVDTATQKKLMETYPVTLIEASDVRMDATLKAADTAFLLQLAGWGIGASTVVANDPAIFLLDNDSTVTVQSTTIQGYNDADSVKTYKHDYTIGQEGLEMLSRHRVVAVRKYSVIGHEDIYLGERDGANLRSLFAIFLAQLGKEKLLKTKEKAVATAPAFPGGTAALLSFFNNNLKLASPAETAVPPIAVLQFQVTVDGSIHNIQVKESAGTLYDNELVRIVKRMPRWKPAQEDGKLVNAMVTQAIGFYRTGETIKVRL
jgi:hypothetical protein